MPESASAATDLDLISYLKAIPDARMRRGVHNPAWYLLLVAVLGVLSRCQSLRDVERFAIRHHSVLTEALGLELRWPPSDSSFRYFVLQVDVAALCAVIPDWTVVQNPRGAADLDQLIGDDKTLKGSIEPTAGGGSTFIAQVTPDSTALARCLNQIAVENSIPITTAGNRQYWAKIKRLALSRCVPARLIPHLALIWRRPSISAMTPPCMTS